MPEPLNPLRRAWSRGHVALNGWIAVPSIITAEAMAAAGYDALTVDMQHGTADYAALLTLLPVIEKSGAAAIVRVPWLEEGAVMRALDAGALNIIAPMIETGEDAARFVSACRYPPEGGRSFGPIRARFAWGVDYAKRANAEVVPLAMVETRKAVANLDAILAVPGLGGIYIGPADLSVSHGYPPGFDREEPEMLGVILGILDKCKAANLPCCLHCGTAEYAARMADRGFAMFTVGSDARFVEAGAMATARAYRKGIAGTN